ncbi:helix-turn-helix domain-containing protein [Streptomyces sparsogenes]|uniref:helix-turn-helix domain-containing protein n=1 Tax=Streptomyces sparsogenes TaxID=67365 RepID=UPI0033EDD1B7
MPIPVLKPGKHITPEVRDEIAALFKSEYEEGKSIRRLAEECGRSFGFVHRLLEHAGVTFRSRGGAHWGPAARERRHS